MTKKLHYMLPKKTEHESTSAFVTLPFHSAHVKDLSSPKTIKKKAGSTLAIVLATFQVSFWAVTNLDLWCNDMLSKVHTSL